MSEQQIKPDTRRTHFGWTTGGHKANAYCQATARIEYENPRLTYVTSQVTCKHCLVLVARLIARGAA